MATMPSSSSTDSLCPNWIFSNTSNVHACKNRGWFTEYTPFESSVGSLHFDHVNIPVIGVGKVVLPVEMTVESSPSRSGANHTQLVLHDVVHCPSVLCNIIGYTTTMEQQYAIQLWHTEESKGSISDMQGRRITYFAPDKTLYQVKLSEPPIGPNVGPSVLEGGNYMLNVYWPEPEQARWQAVKQSRDRRGDDHQEEGHPQENPQPRTAQHVRSNARWYILPEKQWLKRHNYVDECHFLQNFGLNVYKDEDREKGRAIARQLMAEDTSSEREEESVPAKLEGNRAPANTEKDTTQEKMDLKDLTRT